MEYAGSLRLAENPFGWQGGMRKEWQCGAEGRASD